MLSCSTPLHSLDGKAPLVLALVLVGVPSACPTRGRVVFVLLGSPRDLMLGVGRRWKKKKSKRLKNPILAALTGAPGCLVHYNDYYSVGVVLIFLRLMDPVRVFSLLLALKPCCSTPNLRSSASVSEACREGKAQGAHKTCLRAPPGLSPAPTALLELPGTTQLTRVKRVKDTNLFDTQSLSWWENVLPGTQRNRLYYYS